jgi:hypothetical protein
MQKKKPTKLKYKPDLTPIDILKYKEKIKTSEDFKKVFKINLTEHILKEIRDKYNPQVDFENHFVGVCYGGTGKGKSIGMLSLCKTINPYLKVDNIFFHNQQIIDAMPEMERPDIILRDENIDFAQFGSGSYRIKAQLEAITQTLRKRGISFIFISVSPFELDSAHYYFEVLDMDKKKRITRFGVIDPATKKYLGAFYQKVISDKDPLFLKYTERKEEFMQTILDMDFTKGKPVYQKLIDMILQELNIHTYITKKERKLYIQQRFSNMTKSEIEELSTMLELQLREKEKKTEKEESNIIPRTKVRGF